MIAVGDRRRPNGKGAAPKHVVAGGRKGSAVFLRENIA